MTPSICQTMKYNAIISIILFIFFQAAAQVNSSNDTLDNVVNIKSDSSTVPNTQNLTTVKPDTITSDKDSLSSRQLTISLSPLVLQIRPAGFSTFDFDAGVQFQQRALTATITYQMALIPNGIFNSRGSDSTVPYDEKSIKTYYRSFEAGAGYTISKRWNQKSESFNNFQIRAGLKTLEFPDISTLSDSIPAQKLAIDNNGNDSSITINSSMLIVYTGFGIVINKETNARQKRLQAFADFFYTPILHYTLNNNDGSTYNGVTNKLLLQSVGGRIGIEGIESSHRYRLKFRWSAEIGVRPGVHDEKAHFATGTDSIVKYWLYNIYAAGKLGLIVPIF